MKYLNRNRCFILVDPNDVKIFKDKIDACQYKSIKGTLKLHQVSNKVRQKAVYLLEILFAHVFLAVIMNFNFANLIYPSPEIFSSIAYMSKETNFKEISFY